MLPISDTPVLLYCPCTNFVYGREVSNRRAKCLSGRTLPGEAANSAQKPPRIGTESLPQCRWGVRILYRPESFCTPQGWKASDVHPVEISACGKEYSSLIRRYGAFSPSGQVFFSGSNFFYCNKLQLCRWLGPGTGTIVANHPVYGYGSVDKRLRPQCWSCIRPVAEGSSRQRQGQYGGGL